MPILVLFQVALLIYLGRKGLRRITQRPEMIYSLFGVALLSLIFLEANLLTPEEMQYFTLHNSMQIFGYTLTFLDPLYVPFTINWLFAYLSVGFFIPLLGEAQDA